jgi:probable HAF family extracellular repeat protein
MKKVPLNTIQRPVIWLAAIVLLAALAVPLHLPAQQQKQNGEHRHYVLVDLGTFGGPNSYLPSVFFTGNPAASISDQGAVAGSADLSTPDPYAPACFNSDCMVSHAFRWIDGVRTDLEALPGPTGSSSAASWISRNGLIVGFSENGTIDPGAGGPAFLGVLWKDGKVIPLAPLKGGLESVAQGVNSNGIVVGFSSNDRPDPNSLFATQTQTRAVVWHNGMVGDLGTLGGADAEAIFVNERGQIVGQSYVPDSIQPPNLHCSDDPLTLHGFFWEAGRMIDLETLGGHCTFVYALNNRGQVVGQSTLPEDETSHPFLWEGGRMTDLHALGGNYGYASWINDNGEIVGAATNKDDLALIATLWEGDKTTNLGTLKGDSCSTADALNSAGQAVGGSGFNDAAFFPACTDAVEHAVLWENGDILDLNQFGPAGSQLTLNEATFINDRGEISGFASLPNGDTHAFVLIPCDEEHDNLEGCADVDQVPNATEIRLTPAATSTQPRLIPRETLPGSHVRLNRRDRTSGVRAPTAPFNLAVNALDTYQLKLAWQIAPGQNQTGFNIYRCHGCSSPRTQGTRIASVGASFFTDTDGSSANSLTESTIYTYQVTAINTGGESGPSNAASATTRTEPAPTNLGSFAFKRGFDDIVGLSWTNNSTDDNSYYVESCTGPTCENFRVIAQLAANATTYSAYFQFAQGRTVRYRARTHSPGGYSAYSNIRTLTLP